MKTRVFYIALIALVAFLFVGCDHSAAEVVRPFSVNLPEKWAGRAVVEYQEDGVDIVIDETPMLQLRVVENIPGAREKAAALQTDGYEWDYRVEVTSSRYLFFTKAADTLPEELYLLDKRMSARDHADYALREIIKYPLEQDIFDLDSYEYTYTSYDAFGEFVGTQYLGVLKTNTYTNHLMGISFTVPEAVREMCWIDISDGSITLYLKTGQTENARLYYMCQFFAYPPGHELREIYIEREYYPEVVSCEDGYLYGAINDWQPDIPRSLYDSTYYWDKIPLNFRNMITTEEVQQIVDSFTILLQDTDSDG